jgi:peroxiredoxin
MNQNVKKLSCFLVIFFFFLIAVNTTFARTRPVTAGEDFPDLVLNRNLSKADYRYLGVKKSKQETFNISEINADLILLEILSVYCPSCQHQAPIFVSLYNMIENDPRTRGRVKMIGIAAGNNEKEIETFKKRYHVPFPIVPDEKFEILDIIGSTRAPFNILIRKSRKEMVIAHAHLGVISDPDPYFTDMNTIMTYRIAAIKKEGTLPEDESLKPDISREKLLVLMKQGIKESSPGEPIIDWKEIRLENKEIVYIGKTKSGKEFFAKTASRKAICDLCEDTHFIFVFDKKGKITNLVPLSLTKYGNKKWTEEDLKKIKSRVVGKYIYNPFDFDFRVDAVSTATMTSALIFNSLERAHTVYKELKEKGYLN